VAVLIALILDASAGGKVLTYLFTIFSAIEVSKAVSKRRPESDELELSSAEPWDTFKAQVLAKISKNLAPRALHFDDYKIMYFIPRLVPKPSRQLTTADNYTSLLKLLEKSSNKVTPAINVIIEQKTADKDKENTTTTNSKDGAGEKKVLVLHYFTCRAIFLMLFINLDIEEEGCSFTRK